MSRPRFGKTRAVFPSGYVVRNPLFLLVYPLALASPRLRSFMVNLPPSRIRAWLLALFFHRQFFEWSRGNVDTIVRAFDPELQLEMFLGLGTYYGPEGVRQVTEAWGESFIDLQFELEEWIDVGEGEFVAVLHIRGQGVGSGVPVDQQVGMAWSVRDGSGVRSRAYPSKGEALEAAGLSE